jgi:hypothetical protein
LEGFLRSKPKLHLYFLHNKAAKKFKTIGAYTQSTDLIFKTFKKIIHLMTQTLKKLSAQEELKSDLQKKIDKLG